MACLPESAESGNVRTPIKPRPSITQHRLVGSATFDSIAANVSPFMQRADLSRRLHVAPGFQLPRSTPHLATQATVMAELAEWWATFGGLKSKCNLITEQLTGRMTCQVVRRHSARSFHTCSPQTAA